MTELERTLKNTLLTLEQDLTATQKAHSIHISGQPPTQSGKPRPGHPATTGVNRPTPGRTAGISAALATFERYTRELGTALVVLERLVERQIERLHEQHQRSRGPRLGM
jgi:hypothetical protein